MMITNVELCRTLANTCQYMKLHDNYTVWNCNNTHMYQCQWSTRSLYGSDLDCHRPPNQTQVGNVQWWCWRWLQWWQCNTSPRESSAAGSDYSGNDRSVYVVAANSADSDHSTIHANTYHYMNITCFQFPSITRWPRSGVADCHITRWPRSVMHKRQPLGRPSYSVQMGCVWHRFTKYIPTACVCLHRSRITDPILVGPN